MSYPCSLFDFSAICFDFRIRVAVSRIILYVHNWIRCSALNLAMPPYVSHPPKMNAENLWYFYSGPTTCAIYYSGLPHIIFIKNLLMLIHAIANHLYILIWIDRFRPDRVCIHLPYAAPFSMNINSHIEISLSTRGIFYRNFFQKYCWHKRFPVIL